MSPGRVHRRRYRRPIGFAAGLLVGVVTAPSALAGTDSVRFDFGENGTWTVPDGVTEIVVEIAGGGGGSGTGWSSPNQGAQGGMGALVEATVAVTSAQVFDVGVGGGGSGNNLWGGGGGASRLSSGTTLIIAGGGGGAGKALFFGGDASGVIGSDGGGGLAGKGGVAGRGGAGGVAGTAGGDYDVSAPLATAGGAGSGGAIVGGAGGPGLGFGFGGGGGAGYGGGGGGVFDHGGGAGASIATGNVGIVLNVVYSAAGGSGAAGGAAQASGGDGWVVITWTIPVIAPRTQSSEAPLSRELCCG
jgi:hypothetical protein